MKKNKLLSILTPEQLIEEFKNLGTVPKIAKKYNINTQTVYTAFKLINYDCKVRQDVASLVSKEILQESYNRLKSLKAVGRELNITSDSIKDYMDKFGLEYKKQVIYNCNHSFFSSQTEESFYVAGFLAADGCVKNRKSPSQKYGSTRHEVYIGLSKNDKEHLLKIKKLIAAETPIRDYLVKNSKRNPNWNDSWKSEISITSKEMFDDLAKFNIVPRKSLIYTMPDWMKDHPLKHHFLRGYHDGDGSVYKSLSKGKIVEQLCFSLRGTQEFLLIVRDILEKECDLDHRNTPIRISSGHGVLEYGGNGIVKKICDYLYRDASVYLERKFNIVNEV